MLYFARWKVILIWAACVIGILIAVPNGLPRAWLQKWPSWLPGQVTLGLDLQGGSHYVLEVGVKGVQQDLLNNLADSVRTELRKAQIRFRDVGVDGSTVVVSLREAADFDKALEIARRADRGVTVTGRGSELRVVYAEEFVRQRRQEIVDQSIDVIRRRVDETGTKDPTILRQGEDRILIQLPGVNDPRMKEIIARPAKLEFRLVNENVTAGEVTAGTMPANTELRDYAERDSGGVSKIPVFKRVVVGGESLVGASPANDQGRWIISFRFDNAGGRRFCTATSENIGKRLAIDLDKKIISAPVIQGQICGGSGIITGSFTAQTAADLALLLRSGALPASLTYIEERTVGAELGADSIEAGELAAVLGFVLIAVLMVVGYGFFGLIANFCLVLNMVFTLALMQLIGATLTLPGIAGMVLGLAMAVDANVLIYERMREEERNGRTPISAIDFAFQRAYVTILDSNITTLIAAIILYALGSGPVRGFAVTLALGIMCSMFTAVTVTRGLVGSWVYRTRPKSLPI